MEKITIKVDISKIQPRRKWTMKPFDRIKTSGKVYDRRKVKRELRKEMGY